VSSTLAILIVVGILAFATFLILLPRIVGRREAKRLEERSSRRSPVAVDDAPTATIDDEVVVLEAACQLVHLVAAIAVELQRRMAVR